MMQRLLTLTFNNSYHDIGNQQHMIIHAQSIHSLDNQSETKGRHEECVYWIPPHWRQEMPSLVCTQIDRSSFSRL